MSFKGNGLPNFNFPRQPRRIPVPPVPPAPLDEVEEPGVPVAGARLGAVDDSLRAQLDIPEGQGAVVLGVAPGSLAESLGMKKNDVLLELDGKKITSPESAKGLVTKESTGTALRKGRKVTLGAKKDFDTNTPGHHASSRRLRDFLAGVHFKKNTLRFVDVRINELSSKENLR